MLIAIFPIVIECSKNRKRKELEEGSTTRHYGDRMMPEVATVMVSCAVSTILWLTIKQNKVKKSSRVFSVGLYTLVSCKRVETHCCSDLFARLSF